MASYTPLRSLLQEDEVINLDTDPGETYGLLSLSSRDNDQDEDGDEHEQHHRDDDDYDNDNVYTDQLRRRSTPKQLLRWKLGFAAMAIVFLSSLIYFFAWVIRTNGRSISIDFQRPADEYVLDPDWGFVAPSQVREFNWTISDIVGRPDGVARPLLAINGRFPGPLIRVNEGDTIRINLVNSASNSTSLHFHGIYQNGTAWMDGVPGISQCPIAPGRNYTYEFSVKGQYGTYYYHAHHGAQSLDGLVGPLIVHSPTEKSDQMKPYSSDRVVLLQDWYHSSSHSLLMEALSPGAEDPPVPDSVLLNGMNKVDCAAYSHRNCDSSMNHVPSFNLYPGSGNRLRIINAGAIAWFDVSVDGHDNLSLTEVDGSSIAPASEKSLMIGPGQRYSIVIGDDDREDGEVSWFRARIVRECITIDELPEGVSGEIKAVIRYGGNITDPSALGTHSPASAVIRTVECKDMKNDRYHPIPSRHAPDTADHTWYLRVNMQIGNWRLQRGALNESTFRPKLDSPSLHRVINGLQSNNKSFFVEGAVNDQAFDKSNELVVSNNANEVVDIILQNMDEGNHPFHLHGHQFFVLASGHGYFPGYGALGLRDKGHGVTLPRGESLLRNPLRRDVAAVEGFGWLLVRFIADNPGLWYFHCHISFHENAGMGMQFLSRADLMSNWSIPVASTALCDAELNNLKKGGVPDDSIWYGSGIQE